MRTRADCAFLHGRAKFSRSLARSASVSVSAAADTVQYATAALWINQCFAMQLAVASKWRIYSRRARNSALNAEFNLHPVRAEARARGRASSWALEANRTDTIASGARMMNDDDDDDQLGDGSPMLRPEESASGPK